MSEVGITLAEYVLFTDSSCDLPMSMVDKMELTVLPLTLTMNGKSYVNTLDEKNITYTELYRMLPKATEVKTSAVNQHAFEVEMEPVLQAGKDILYIGFSSGLSGTYSAGELAAQVMREKYPERKIYTVDTLCASLGEGLLVYLCWQQKAAGKSIEEVRDYCEENKLHVCHWFTVDDLMHLKRGGRVSATSALIGTVLGIKPVMHVDNDGLLKLVDKARGRKASIKRLITEVKNRAIEPTKYPMAISHGGCLDEANAIADMLKKELGVPEVIVNYCGPVVGAHSGPGTLALFCLGSER